MPPGNPARGFDSDDSHDSQSQSEEEQEHHPPKKGELFKDGDNSPINFYMHQSVKSADAIRKLTADITENGGRVVHNLKNASIVLVSSKYTMEKALQKSYDAARDPNLHKIYVRPAAFVMKCIKEQRFYIYDPEIKGMRGCPPGGRRTEFNEEDDDNLCYYLSRLMPEKGAGGRTGHNIYKLLVEMAVSNPDMYGWAKRHPYDSWRGRYKKNQEEMDAVIAEMVEEDPPTEKQLWREDRRLNKPSRVIRYEEEEEEEEEEGEEEEDEVQAVARQMENLESGSEETARRNKRTQSRRSSNWGEPPAKKSRLAPRHSSPNRNEAERPVSSKGKGRAFDDDDEEMQNESDLEYLFTGDFDDGPSARMIASEPDFLTQDTLVSATPRGIFEKENTPPNDYNRRSPSPLPSPTLIPLHMRSPSVRNSGPSAPIPSPSPTRVQIQIPADTPGPIASSPPAKKALSPPRPSNTEYQRPKMAARRPMPVRKPVIVNSGPSRNTRSRSQAPQEIVPPLPQKTKAKKKEAIPEVIEVSEDDVEQQPPQQPAILPDSQRVHEISEDERDVDGLHHEPEESAQRVERAASMDTDDAQTKRDLSGPSNPSSSLDINPLDILQRLRTQSSKSQGVGSRSGRSLHTSSRHGSGSPSKSFQTSNPTRAPVTPVKGHRAGSSSSTESFPLSGTKASAMKKRIQQQEKNTPYKPPPGTRAALLAGKR